MSRSVNRIVTIGLVALLPACASTRHAAVKDTTKTFKTVVVDAGHGGKDSGAYRRYGPPEKLVTLDVTERLDRKLRESQLKTVMTRSSDVFIPLDERVNIENSQKSAIFVSVHFNDSLRRWRLSRFYSGGRTTATAEYFHRQHRTRASSGTSLKFFPALFGSNRGEQHQRQKNHEREDSQRFCVIRLRACATEMIR